MTIISKWFGRTPQPQDDGRVEEATREFAQAVSELSGAQEFFDRVEPSNTHMVDEAVYRLNVARMRVDNASRVLRELKGLPSPDDLREARENDGKKTSGAA